MPTPSSHGRTITGVAVVDRDLKPDQHRSSPTHRRLLGVARRPSPAPAASAIVPLVAGSAARRDQPVLPAEIDAPRAAARNIMAPTTEADDHGRRSRSRTASRSGELRARARRRRDGTLRDAPRSGERRRDFAARCRSVGGGRSGSAQRQRPRLRSRAGSSPPPPPALELRRVDPRGGDDRVPTGDPTDPVRGVLVAAPGRPRFDAAAEPTRRGSTDRHGGAVILALRRRARRRRHLARRPAAFSAWRVGGRPSASSRPLVAAVGDGRARGPSPERPLVAHADDRPRASLSRRVEEAATTADPASRRHSRRQVEPTWRAVGVRGPRGRRTRSKRKSHRASIRSESTRASTHACERTRCPLRSDRPAAAPAANQHS